MLSIFMPVIFQLIFLYQCDIFVNYKSVSDLMLR